MHQKTKFGLLVLLMACIRISECDQLLLEQEYKDTELAAIGLCMVNCGDINLNECFKSCSKQTVSMGNFTRNVNFNFAVDLVCRDSVKFMLNVRANQTSRLQIISVFGVENEHTIISDSPTVEVSKLSPGQAYHVQAIVFISSYEYYFTNAHTVYETMPLDYIPGAISVINVDSYEPISEEDHLLNAIVDWKPTSDMACEYEILYYSAHSDDFHPRPVHVHYRGGPHQKSLKSLEFDTEYEIAVRANNPPYESTLRWTSFQTPDCSSVLNFSRICAPDVIMNLMVETTLVGNKLYRLNISWDKPLIEPDRYEVHVFDLNPDLSEDLAHSISLNISGNSTFTLLDSFPIESTQFEVFVVAHANDRSTSRNIISTIDTLIPSTRNHWIDALVIIIIITLLLLGKVLISFLYKRFRLVEQCDKPLAWKGLELSSDIEIRMENLEGGMESQVLPGELIAPINDGMEVALEQIQLMDVLGEGAFGFVRKGLLKTSAGENEHVAVKMLKECPTLGDIKAFRREIEVMKSVGSHPNVVCIVGQYTKNVTKMMLLTEYCSGGNLLCYLRGIWNRMLRSKMPNCTIVEENESMNKTINNSGYATPRSSYNFDTELPTMVENKLYEHEQNYLNQYDNQCYFEEDDDHSNFLMTSNKLVDFAQQIACGMEFLARNRVVHRDLAARNILVMDDTTVKISDFGLSRDIYQENMYRKTTNGKLPIKWLALESLTHQVYTSQSDVWSFGIVLYEICTLGGNPYPMLETSKLLLELKNGYRMEKPASCSDELYELMMKCWSALPSERPTFSVARNRLGKMIELGQNESRILIDMSGIMN